MDNQYHTCGVKLALTYLIKSNIIPTDCIQIIYNNVINNIIANNNINSILEFDVYYKYNIISKNTIWSFFCKKNYTIIKHIVINKLYKNIINDLYLLIYCMYNNLNVKIFDFIFKLIIGDLHETWKDILISYILSNKFKDHQLLNKYFKYFNKNKIFFCIDYDCLCNIAFNNWLYLDFLIDNNIIVELSSETQDIEILINFIYKDWTNAATVYFENYLTHKHYDITIYNYCKNNHSNNNDIINWIDCNL